MAENFYEIGEQREYTDIRKDKMLLTPKRPSGILKNAA